MGELLRKLIHLCGLFVPASYLLLDREEAQIFFGAMFALTILGEVARFLIAPVNKIFLLVFSGMTRDFEKDETLGATYFAASSFLVILLFPSEIAVSCMLYLILGDTAAALFGKRFGKHRLGKKSLEGSFSFFAVSFLSSLMFLGPLASFLGAVSATVTEALSEIDNLTIPLISGFVLYAFFALS